MIKKTMYNYAANIQQRKAFVKRFVKFSSALKTSKTQNILTIKILIVNFLERIFAGFGGALPPIGKIC